METKNSGEKIILTLARPDTAEKRWSPARFAGENLLRKRHFEKIPEEGRLTKPIAGS